MTDSTTSAKRDFTWYIDVYEFLSSARRGRCSGMANCDVSAARMINSEMPRLSVFIAVLYLISNYSEKTS
jgi:hypothetical protein